MAGPGKKVEAEAETPLKDAVREARIEAAERSAVVVDLRDAELARLELLNEALDPLFKELPDDVELFDRGVSRGDVPRLWVDVVAHVEMGRDKRQYRFVQDTRYGRAVLAESYDVPDMVQAITRYVARRLVERERALTDDAGSPVAQKVLSTSRRRSRWRAIRAFVLGLIVGVGALVVLALLNSPRP
jgi:CRP-like cAMP-binding protein